MARNAVPTRRVSFRHLPESTPQTGPDYVWCSPHRAPVACLAVAQDALRDAIRGEEASLRESDDMSFVGMTSGRPRLRPEIGNRIFSVFGEPADDGTVHRGQGAISGRKSAASVRVATFRLLGLTARKYLIAVARILV